MHYVEVYLEAENGKFVERFKGQNNLSPSTFVSDANFLTVTISATAVDPCVWDAVIDFKFRDLTSYTMYIVAELLLLECTAKFFLLAYSNSMNRVWDPGQPCRKQFSEKQAEKWWAENRASVYELYNVCVVDKGSISTASVELAH